MPDHREQNGCQSDELIFRAWCLTGAVKLKTMWYTTKVGIKFDLSTALIAALKPNFVKSHVQGFRAPSSMPSYYSLVL